MACNLTRRIYMHFWFKRLFIHLIPLKKLVCILMAVIGIFPRPAKRHFVLWGHIECAYLPIWFHFRAVFLDICQSIPHPAISPAKLELFTRQVAIPVPTRISHVYIYIIFIERMWTPFTGHLLLTWVFSNFRFSDFRFSSFLLGKYFWKLCWWDIEE